MANSLQSVADSLRSNRNASTKRRSSGTAVMDTVDEGTAERGPNGFRIVRTARILGITGVPHSKIPDALNAKGLPRYGDPHPSPLADGLPLSLMTASILEGEPDKAIVTLTYEYPNTSGGIGFFENTPSVTTAAQLEVTTTLNQLTTNLDVDGNAITVTYVQPLFDDDGVTIIGSDVKVQGGEITTMVPTTSVNYMRREPVSPLEKAKVYVGTTGASAGTGFGDIFGDPDDYWMCTHIGGPSDDGGLSYNVTHSFQRAEPHRIRDAGGVIAEFSGWQAVVVYIDPETGKPPPDLLSQISSGGTSPIVIDTFGVESKIRYRSTNFWNLNLTPL